MTIIELFAELKTPGQLRIRDVTPVGPTGWGAPNVAKSAVTKYKLSASYAGRPPFTWELSGGITDDFAAGKYILSAGQLALNTNDLPCNPADAGAFRSGCLTLKIDAIAPETLTRYRANYFIQLAVPLYSGVTVWVKKEGVWTNITSEGTTNGTGWYWEKLNALDLYTSYEVRMGSTVLQPGTVTRQQLESTGTIRAGQPVVVGQGTLTIFLTGAERKRWADKVLAWVETEIDPTKRSATRTPYSTASLGDCAVCELTEIGNLLDFLDDWENTDCNSGMTLLTVIQAKLDQWDEQH